jgi:hypothetical protein
MIASLVLALTAGQRDLWTVLLVVGLVVLAVVVALLHRLYTEVVRVDEGAKGVWSSATRLARNTATTWQLGATAAALEAVREEARRHDALLEGRR